VVQQLVEYLPTQWVAVRLCPQTAFEGVAEYNQTPLSVPVDQAESSRAAGGRQIRQSVLWVFEPASTTVFSPS
jgi:hypothetical protein